MEATEAVKTPKRPPVQLTGGPNKGAKIPLLLISFPPKQPAPREAKFHFHPRVLEPAVGEVRATCKNPTR